MKLRYILLLLLFVTMIAKPESGFTQTKSYKFEYDDSGNRELRLLKPLKSTNTITDESSQVIFEEVLDKGIIKIYPNPTKGNLMVVIPFRDNSSRVTMQIFNMQGMLLREMAAVSETSLIDFSRWPSGMYILRIFSENSATEWKIIKE